jgi:hypothetical protein
MSADLRDERGSVPAEWALGVVVLVLPALLLAGALPAWAARRDAASAAAREAARVAAVAPEAGAAAATAAAHALLDGRGVAPGGRGVVVALPPGSPRDGAVTATVTLPAVHVDVPLLGVVAGPAVTARHTAPLDPYRSRP